MGTIFVVAVITFVIIGISKGATNNPTSKYDSLVKSGIPARGILLQVAPTGTLTGTISRRFEIRQVYVDVELPGKPPYETNAAPIIPINLVRDVLPGATVELRVDPRRPSIMAIVGPGTGFVQQALRTA